MIYVKGLDKKRWLERLVNNKIIDLHEEGCPSLTELQSVFRSNHCFQHTKFNSLSCALENVYYLWYWYSMYKKIK